MTDRYNALTVILDKDLRDDDAEAIIAAIRQIRHVLDVKPHIADAESYIAHERARAELVEKIWDVLKREQ